MIKVEYLLPFNTKDRVCKDINSFNSLLSVHSDISVTKNKIKFKKSKYDYSVTLDEVSNQNYSVFHVTFSINRTTDKFREMLKAVRQIVGVHIKNDIQIIWDGVGFEWSKELYPKIYKVENNLRKLISKFMLLNLGLGWHKSSVPTTVKESMKSNKGKENHSILYEVDFIQLAHFLFKPYSIKNINGLPKIINKMLDKELTELEKKEIEDYIPKNNWDRYFSDIVEIETEQLESKWTKLYDIRNKIAHNKSLKELDLTTGNELCGFLLPIIEDAINSLENINIPENERETISLNTMATVNNSIKPFITDYQYFSKGVLETINQNQDVFMTISDSIKPIQTIIENVNLHNPFVNNGLTEALGSIENAKDLIISGENMHNWPTDLIDSKLFIDASQKIQENYKTLKISDNITTFIGGDTEQDNKDLE